MVYCPASFECFGRDLSTNCTQVSHCLRSVSLSPEGQTTILDKKRMLPIIENPKTFEPSLLEKSTTLFFSFIIVDGNWDIKLKTHQHASFIIFDRKSSKEHAAGRLFSDKLPCQLYFREQHCNVARIDCQLPNTQKLGK